MRDVETIFDKLTVRCPQLGGSVDFKYCRKVADGLPCARSLICWEASFPVDQYMVRILNEDEWRRVFEEPSKNRLDKILEAAGRPNPSETDL
jgi:hypothetical protein